jgi:hypothetical protein
VYELINTLLLGVVVYCLYKGLLSRYSLYSSIVVKALCYKPEGREFGTQCGEFLNLPNPSGSTRLWGLLSL